MNTSRTNRRPGLAAQAAWDAHIAALVESPAYIALTTGQCDSYGYDQFIVNVVRTHVNSPQLLAFLYAVAPPMAASSIEANMLEELGRLGPGGMATRRSCRSCSKALDSSTGSRSAAHSPTWPCVSSSASRCSTPRSWSSASPPLWR